MRIHHLLLVLTVMMIFGSAYPVGKLALNLSLPPFLFGAIRLFLVFVFLAPVWRFRPIEKKYRWPLTGFALSMGAGVFMFMYLALANSSSVSAIIIGTQLSIPVGLLMSSFFLKERFPAEKWIWIFGAFAGVAVIAFEPSLLDDFLGLIYVAIMSFFYALAQVFSRHLKEVPVTTTNAVMGIMGSAVLLVFSLAAEGNPAEHLANIGIETWALILHSSVVVSLIAHQSMFYLYKFYPVDKVLPYYSLFPVFGIILTFIIFRETPSPVFFLGAFLVLGSVFMLNRRRPAKKGRAQKKNARR